jgi:hypothetical protein
MHPEQLIAPTGIASFLMFSAAAVTGIRRFRLLKYHRIAGYLCVLVVAIHFALAASADFYEITGLAAGVCMLLTAISGILLKRRFRLHLLLTILTFIVTSLHVVMSLYFG